MSRSRCQRANRFVGAVGGKAGVRARLLQDHLVASPGINCGVDAAAVGRMQSFFDTVRQVRDRDGFARLQIRGEERGQFGPAGNVEYRRSAIGNQAARIVFDGSHEFTAIVLAVSFRETSVAHVKRAVAIPQIAQNVRAGLALKKAAELGQDEFELSVVRRVDRNKFPAGTAVRVLGVAHMQCQPAAQALEGDHPVSTVFPGQRKHVISVVEAARDVDLPTLRGDHFTGRRDAYGPFALGELIPSLGQRLRHEVKVTSAAGEPCWRIIEQGVRQAVKLVPLIQWNPYVLYREATGSSESPIPQQFCGPIY